MWYLFRQNNSGGMVRKDENVDWYVYIEAESANQANAKAEDIGIYFHGVSGGRDCECCGDRWYPVDEFDGEEEDKTLEEWVNTQTGIFEACGINSDYAWTAHYLDGTKRRGNFTKPTANIQITQQRRKT